MKMGGRRVLRLEEVERPVADAGEVLVRVARASVNPIDWKRRRGLTPTRLPAILGSDASSVSSSRSPTPKGFGAGEEVFGFLGTGSYAEFGDRPPGHPRPQARPPLPRTGGGAARRRAHRLAGAVRARGPGAGRGADQRRLRWRRPPRRAAGRGGGSAGAGYRLAAQQGLRARPGSAAVHRLHQRRPRHRRHRRGPRVRRRRPRHRAAARDDPPRRAYGRDRRRSPRGGGRSAKWTRSC